jgi:hypothetical protein
MSCPPIDLTSSPALAPQELETVECLIWSDGVEIISIDLERKILFMNDLERSGGALSPDYLLRLMMFRQAFDEKRKNEITTQEFMDRIFSWNSHRTLQDFIKWGIYEPETDTLHIV